jgi:hypothetical protein
MPGNYTPGAESSLDILCSLINASWRYGLERAAEYRERLDLVVNPDTGWLSSLSAPHIAAGEIVQREVVEPEVDIPATASAQDVMDLFDSRYLELFELLKQAFVDFRAEYFPEEQALYGAAEDWLRAALADPLHALPPAVADRLFTDSRDRVLREAQRAQDTLLAGFAARRFPLPPGAAADAMLQIQQGAQDKIAEAARKLVTDWLQNIQFAVTSALQLRQSAMDSAIRYITALASGPDLASRAVNVAYDAQSKLISAAASFYNSRIGVQEMKMKIDQFNTSGALEAASKNQAADLALIDARVKALLAECAALAQQATALFNNVQASASTGYSVNGSSSPNGSV